LTLAVRSTSLRVPQWLQTARTEWKIDILVPRDQGFQQWSAIAASTAAGGFFFDNQLIA
jgi:hypothetical protein